MENTFITALVRAGLCRQHGTEHPSRLGSYSRGLGSSHVGQYASKAIFGSVHAFHSKTHRQALALRLAEQPAEEDPRHYLDYYIRHDQVIREPSEAEGNFELPTLEPPEIDSTEEPKILFESRPFLSEQEAVLVEEIRKMVEADSENQQQLYEAYRNLPHPRIIYLSRKLREKFLLRLCVVEKKTTRIMQNYMSVLDDKKVAGIPILESEWNSAIHLIGRHLTKVSTEEAEAAVLLYKEMERAGLEGNHVTLNILFDITVKAGDFTFAEVILKEMKNRGLELDRYGSVGLIYYHGLRHDGQGVRDAYMDLIDRGQIVDTVVLNCVIASLLNAGERAASEQVYCRMRNMYAKKAGYVFEPQSFRDKRDIAKILNKASKTVGKSLEALERPHQECSRAPNFETFKILLRYHVEITGELQSVTALFDDMATVGVPAYGRFYMDLFKGFALHGGVPYTAWTKSRLESIWRSFMSAAAVGDDSVYVGKWTVIWALRAFNKCGGHEAALARWEVVKKQWYPTQEETELIHAILSHHEHLEGRGWRR